MLKQLFGKRPTTKTDIILAFGAAAFAVIKAFDVAHEYKKEQEKENEQ